MRISKTAFGQIIRASATSDQPIDGEFLREIAVEHGDDPDALVARHYEMREAYLQKKDDDAQPMPFIT